MIQAMNQHWHGHITQMLHNCSPSPAWGVLRQLLDQKRILLQQTPGQELCSPLGSIPPPARSSPSPEHVPGDGHRAGFGGARGWAGLWAAAARLGQRLTALGADVGCWAVGSPWGLAGTVRAGGAPGALPPDFLVKFLFSETFLSSGRVDGLLLPLHQHSLTLLGCRNSLWITLAH